jgi:hypothetical protein
MSDLRRAALLVGALALLAAGAWAGAWESDRRLTFGPGQSLTSYNFARSVAAEPDGRVHVVWYDDRGGSSQIYTKRSLDHGVTSWVPTVEVAGEAVHVAWVDTQDGNEEEYYRRSIDGGRT